MDFDRIAQLIADDPESPDRYEAFLLSLIPGRPSRVLEIGCGAGRLARSIAAKGATVTAVDVSAGMIQLARRRSHDAERVEFVHGDFAAECDESGTYDGIVSVATLHHLPFTRSIERMKDLLRPGGLLLIHDLRAPDGVGDWLDSGVRAALTGDALWWIRNRMRERRGLRHAWHTHGARERYLTMSDVRALFGEATPGARITRHPLWRYTVLWVKG